MDRKKFIQISGLASLKLLFPTYNPNIGYNNYRLQETISREHYNMLSAVINSNRINKNSIAEANEVYHSLLKATSFRVSYPYYETATGKIKKFMGNDEEIKELLSSPLSKRDLIALCTLNENLNHKNLSKGDVSGLLSLIPSALSFPLGVMSFVEGKSESQNLSRANSFQLELCRQAAYKFSEQSNEVIEYLKKEKGINFQITDESNLKELTGEKLSEIVKKKLNKSQIQDSEISDAISSFLIEKNQQFLENQRIFENEKTEIYFQNSFQAVSNVAGILGQNELSVKIQQYGAVGTEIFKTYNKIYNQSPPIDNLAAFTSITGITLTLISLSQNQKDPKAVFLEEIYKKMMEGFQNLSLQIDGLQRYVKDNFSASFKNQQTIIRSLNEIMYEIVQGNTLTNQKLDVINGQIDAFRKTYEYSQKQQIIKGLSEATKSSRIIFSTRTFSYSNPTDLNAIREQYISLLNFVENDCYSAFVTRYNPSDNITDYFIKLKTSYGIEDLLPLLPTILQKTLGFESSYKKLIDVVQWKKACYSIYVLLNYIPNNHLNESRTFNNCLLYKYEPKDVKLEILNLVNHGLKVNSFFKSLSKSLFESALKFHIRAVNKLFTAIKDELLSTEKELTNGRTIFTFYPDIRHLPKLRGDHHFPLNICPLPPQNQRNYRALDPYFKCIKNEYENLGVNVFELVSQNEYRGETDRDLLYNDINDYDLLDALVNYNAVVVEELDFKSNIYQQRQKSHSNLGKPMKIVPYGSSEFKLSFKNNTYKGFSFIGSKRRGKRNHHHYQFWPFIENTNEYFELDVQKASYDDLKSISKSLGKKSDRFKKFLEKKELKEEDVFNELNMLIDNNNETKEYFSELHEDGLFIIKMLFTSLIESNKKMKSDLIGSIDNIDAKIEKEIKEFEYASYLFSHMTNLYEHKLFNNLENQLSNVVHSNYNNWQEIKNVFLKNHSEFKIDVKELLIIENQFLLKNKEMDIVQNFLNSNKFDEEVPYNIKKQYAYLDYTINKVMTSVIIEIEKRISPILETESELFSSNLNYVSEMTDYLKRYSELV